MPQDKVIDLYKELKAIGLSEPGAGTIVDVIACPGTDTCKLGIASSPRPRRRAAHAPGARRRASMDAGRSENLRIKVSGCFNSCGQHHVADLGFYGNSRNVGGYTVPHFQVMLGGKWTRERRLVRAWRSGSVPSKRIPDLVDRADRPVRRASGRATNRSRTGASASARRS